MLDGYNKGLSEQISILKEILYKNNKLRYLLEKLDESGISNYYIAAGCINQTVFNYYHGYDIEYGINDYDIVYFDSDTSYEAEDKVIRKINSLIEDIDIKVDIKNQARVYLWYYEKYGIKRDAYVSVEDAINKWASTVTCIGVRLNKGVFSVYAPYGVNDIFSMVIKPVRLETERNVYEMKSLGWKKKWPKLRVYDWNGNIVE